MTSIPKLTLDQNLKKDKEMRKTPLRTYQQCKVFHRGVFHRVVKLVKEKLLEKTCSLYTRTNKTCQLGKIVHLYGP